MGRGGRWFDFVLWITILIVFINCFECYVRLTLCPMELTGIGLYTPQQAALLSGAKASEVSRWLFGYKTKNRKSMPPLWGTQLSDVERKLIGFRDLMELRMVAAFVRKGVPLRVIRAALEAAKDMFGTDYPLTSQRFLTDGKTVYHEAVEAEGRDLTDLRRRQIVFSVVVRPSLYDGIEFTADGKALRWFPLKDKSVVVDPDLSFGRPSLAGYGVPTEIIALAVKAEKNTRAVAAQFEIPEADVKAAVRFENQLLVA